MPHDPAPGWQLMLSGRRGHFVFCDPAFGVAVNRCCLGDGGVWCFPTEPQGGDGTPNKDEKMEQVLSTFVEIVALAIAAQAHGRSTRHDCAWTLCNDRGL